MSERAVLTGYGFSVYTRAVRIALVAKGVRFSYRESNPFDAADAGRLKELHPFGRVPVLQHGSFFLWETQAMLDYVDAAFDGPGLTPDGARARARMRQVMGIVDAYLYWPLVRGVVSNALFAGPAERDDNAFRAGLDTAPRVLAALDDIAREGLVLERDRLTLADCLLWPMLDYFRQVPEGACLMEDNTTLTLWVEGMAKKHAALETAPDLSFHERSPA